MSDQVQIIEPSEIADHLSHMGYQNFEDAIFGKLQPGRRVLIPALGKPASNTSASVYGFPDGAGAFLRDWVTNTAEPIWPKNTAKLSATELRERTEKAKAVQRQREAETTAAQARVKLKAQKLYREAAISGTNSYIEKKLISGLYNARIDSNGDLLIPMWLSGVGIVNLQRITDTKKLFLKGGRVRDTYSVIGSLDGATRALVAEGWATAATLHEIHALPVVVAFSAGNLLSVCQTLRERFADLDITVCGDDDRQTTGNPGRSKAVEAAQAIGAKVSFPELCQRCTCTDFADVAICRSRRND